MPSTQIRCNPESKSTGEADHRAILRSVCYLTLRSDLSCVIRMAFVFCLIKCDFGTETDMRMSSVTTKAIALLVCLAFIQVACYNRHMIDTGELEKLESDVEAKEQVKVYSDCEGKAKRPDAPASVKKKKCTGVSVSGTNALAVHTKDEKEHRITPFNFMMSQSQLVSPGYDKLLPRDQIEGAEVRILNPWKTIGASVGISAIAIGIFAGISATSESGGLQ